MTASPAKEAILPRREENFSTGIDSGLRQDVPSEYRVRTVGARMGTPLDDLNRKKGGKGPQDSGILASRPHARLRVPAPVVHDSSEEQEVPFQVSAQGHAQHPHVCGRDLRFDIEGVDVLLHERENRFPVRGPLPSPASPAACRPCPW